MTKINTKLVQKCFELEQALAKAAKQTEHIPAFFIAKQNFVLAMCIKNQAEVDLAIDTRRGHFKTIEAAANIAIETAVKSIQTVNTFVEEADEYLKSKSG